jgi:tungstate transport system substrate-binding protein
MLKHRLLGGVFALICAFSSLSHAAENESSIVVASTTSTLDSGLFDYLLPKFRDRSGIAVRVVALGTGQALDLGRRGDADVVFVHDPEAEQKFESEGHGIERRLVMYNDYVIVGPSTDPAAIRGLRDSARALKAIENHKSPFISRGDRSGTHQAELRLWSAAGITPTAADPWYRSVGQGMGAALNMAAASNAYTLADRGTWVKFGNKQELQLLVEGDPRLFNQYGVMLVNPARHPAVKVEAGRAFIAYLVSQEGQRIIAEYQVAGQQLFHPNAGAKSR